jgi:2-amino-4-hydroxy-6-hydroxymethyldihydropteridine diphosphokinase
MYEECVFVGIGGNLASARWGRPLAVMQAAVQALPALGIAVRQRSRWYRSAPVPPSDQPDYINGVLSVATALEPPALLAALHALEADFGRERRVVDAARELDLDLLAYGRAVINGQAGMVLPHPRMHQRLFVLAPLAELAPGWRHPRLDLTPHQLLAALPRQQRTGQAAWPLEEDSPGAA